MKWSDNVLDCDFGDLGVTTMEESLARVTVAAETDREDCAVLNNTAYRGCDKRRSGRFDGLDHVQCPRVEIEKTNNQPDPVLPGTVVAFTLEVTVTDGPAEDVVVVDTLPAGLGDPTSISDGGVWDGTTRTITWDLGDDVAEWHARADLQRSGNLDGPARRRADQRGHRHQLGQPVPRCG